MKVLVVDDNLHYWTIVKPSFQKSGITIEICEHAEVSSRIAAASDFDWVIVHESSSSGGSIIPKLRGISLEDGSKVPCIVVNNRQQDLEIEKRRWADASGILEIRTVLPLPLTPESLRNLVPETNKNAAMFLELLPLPARMLDQNRLILATNTEWNWGDTIPNSKALSSNGAEFSTTRHGGEIEYWGLQEMEQGPTEQILQIAHPLYRIPAASANGTSTIIVENESEALWGLFKGFGAERMRLYLRRETPDGDGTLTLLRSFGESELTTSEFVDLAAALKVKCWKSDCGIISTIIDGDVTKTIERLRKKAYKSGKDGKLAYSYLDAFRSKAATGSANVLFHAAFGISDDAESMYVPVVFDNPLGMRALVVVDCGNCKINDEFKELVERREPSILFSLDQMKLALNALNEAERAKIWKDAWNIVNEQMPRDLTEKSKEDFVRAVVRGALDLCNVSFASIGWQRYDGTNPKVLAVELDENSYDAEGLSKRKNLIGQSCSRQRLPALYEAIEQKSAVFFQNGLQDVGDDDLNDGLPRFALPISVAGRVRGALGLSVSTPDYRFSQLDVDRAKVLIELLGPVLYFLDSVLVSRTWQSTMHHEVLSNLNPATRYLRKLPPSDERDIALWFAQDLLDSFSKLQPNLHHASDFDALDVINSEISNSKTIAEKNFFRYFELSIPTQQFVTFGERAMWSFVVRTLISNSLRHGDTSNTDIKPITIECSVEAGVLSLLVINEAPKLTKDDVDVAFARGAIMTGDRKSDGSHTALADSLSLLQEYGGDLQFERREQAGGVYAWVTAKLPKLTMSEIETVSKGGLANGRFVG